MIRIRYDRKGPELTLQGHAQAGEYGHDLVCAGVSVLVQTLADNVQELAGRGIVWEPVTVVQPGVGRVACVPGEGFGCLVRTVFDCSVRGLELLARAYPEYVDLEMA